VLAIWAWRSWGSRSAPFALAGSLLYLLGGFGVTSAANVPLNDKLDKVAPDSATAAHEWSHYMATWMPWKTRARDRLACRRGPADRCVRARVNAAISLRAAP
jgi:uncharacterized membrane protein